MKRHVDNAYFLLTLDCNQNTKKIKISQRFHKTLGHGAKALWQVPVCLDIVFGCSNYKIVEVGTSWDSIWEVPSTLISILHSPRAKAWSGRSWIAISTSSWVSCSLSQFMTNDTDGSINSRISIRWSRLLRIAVTCGWGNTNPSKFVGCSAWTCICVPSTERGAETRDGDITEIRDCLIQCMNL